MSAAQSDITRASPLTLLVDADADSRDMYAEFLTVVGGYEIDEAGDGREALAKALSRHPDLIVTETRLPGLSGIDLCRLLRSDIATRTIPVIVVTGTALDAEHRRAEQAGADMVLIKPCLPETLFAEMQRLLQRSRELRARGTVARDAAAKHTRRSSELIDASRKAALTRLRQSRARERAVPAVPALPPPVLNCAGCDLPLRYLRSHMGGATVVHAEQWDDFECPGCGAMFQYRHRTRKVRKV
jgi:CheY-like chemotaxis protein